MSGSLVPQNMGAVSTAFAPVQGRKFADDLAGGVTSGFAVVSIRGKDWRIKYRGEEAVVQKDGENVRSIVAVLVKGNPNLSKIYYAKNYAAGDDQAPDCYSINGVMPEDDSKEKQNPVCATCRHNRFGSRITENGKKAKACSDNRRLAIVPLADMDNEVYGGPMLLRVPPASLADMAQFTKKMETLGYPYFSIAVRLGFADEAFPKLTFSAVRALDDAEAQKVLELRADDRVDYMLHQHRASDDAPVTPESNDGGVFEQGPQAAPPKALADQPKEAAPALTAAMNGLDETPAQEQVREEAAPAPNKVVKPGPRTAAAPVTKAAPPPAPPVETKTKATEVAEGDPLADILDGLLPD